MVFFNVFFRTLGFLIGISTFIVIMFVLVSLIPDNDKFIYAEGEEGSKNIIATLELNGPIISNINRSIFGNIVEYVDPNIVKTYLLDLKEIKPKILTIKLNSPGGTVTASANLEKIISNFKKKYNTEVYFYSNETLASGAYWVATGGDRIYANYGSIIGSIGVSGPSWYYYEKPKSISFGLLGQKIESESEIKIFDQNAGLYKDLYNPFRQPSNKELLHLQGMVGEIYDDFVNKVSKSRKIEKNTIRNEIGALIYTGEQAKNNFLIDGVMDFDELIKEVVKNKNFSDHKIIELKTNKNYLSNSFLSYFDFNNKTICKKLNSSFVLLLPVYSNNC